MLIITITVQKVVWTNQTSNKTKDSPPDEFRSTKPVGTVSIEHTEDRMSEMSNAILHKGLNKLFEMN